LRSEAVILDAALILAPLGARAADLVVGWEKASTRRRMRRSRQSSRRSSAAAARRPSSSCTAGMRGEQARATLEAGQAPDVLYLGLGEWITRWGLRGQACGLETAPGPVLDLFDADAVEAPMLLNGGTGRRGLYGLPMGRHANRLNVWNSLLERAGFGLADIPRSGMPSGPAGATKCSRRCARSNLRYDLTQRSPLRSDHYRVTDLG
jgi:hypothetical protein